MPADQVENSGEAVIDPETVQARLDELLRESEERRVELRALAAELPEATSRRALVRSMVASVVHAPDRPLIAKRVVLKLVRTPSDLYRRVRSH